MARILIYGLNYAPEPTGTGKYTGEMAAWLAARGHQVDAIAAPPHYPAWEVDPSYRTKGRHVEYLDGVRVWRVPLFVPRAEHAGARNRILMETSYTLNALRHWALILTRRRSYDAVIAITPPLQIGVFPALYRWLRGVPWTLHVQDLQVDAALRLELIRPGRMGRMLYAFESGLLRRASAVSTISEGMRRRIIAKGIEESRAWLVPNWSDLNFVRPLSRVNTFRRSLLGIGDDEVVLLYAGNMGEKQGLEIVLQVADRLRSETSVRFVMVGDGVARQRLVQRASELALPNVLFLPVQPRERLPEMLAAGDVHLVVQTREAADLVMPSKLTNILAAGRPAVATAAPGTALHEVVAGHGAGLVVPPEDAEALTEAVRSLVRVPALRAEMGRKAREYAEHYLDRDAILSRFESRLLQLITEERGIQR